MKKERLKLVSAMLLLSGFSTGYVQAAPHAAAVEMHSVISISVLSSFSNYDFFN